MKRVSSFFVSVVMFSCIGFSAVGDDLDIYLGTASESATYNPNVLFIMDTSGSMTGKDGTGQSRILRVQNALKEALTSATNIDAGLMRFSDYGGPILFPVSGIDDAIQPELITSTGASSHDASEINGTVNTTANDLVLSSGTNIVTSGMRFTEMNIPQGATILSAHLRFTSEKFNIAGTTLTISGEASATSTEFSTAYNNLSSRTKTASEVEWVSNNDFPSADEVIATPDISSIIQEIVDLPQWCGGKDLNILIEGTSSDAASSREARAFDSGQTGSPQLVVSYDDTTATGCISGESVYQVSRSNDNIEENNNGYENTGSELTFSSNYNSYIGVRFQNVNIPQGAEITEAYIELTAYSSYNQNNSSMLIRGVAANDADDFSSGNRYLLRNIGKTSGVTWSMGSFSSGNDYASPDLSGVVKEIVDRAGWQSGNAMAFVFSDFTGYRGAYTYSGSQSSAAKLVVKFNGSATPGQTSTVREHLISKVDELTASGYTPIVDTLYEAVNYYGGRDVDYGLTRGNYNVSNTVRKNTRVSHRSAYLGGDAVQPNGCSDDNLSDSDCINEYIPSGATYISPVNDLQCQTNNHIVLLSDGEANNNHSVSLIESLLGDSCTGSGGEKCGLNLVKNVSDSDTSVIDRRVITHTIGFAANSTANNFLNQLAVQSGGGFYQADDSTELLEAFNTILRSVKDVNSTFVSPGVAVNQLNRLTHNDELYFALFKPSEGAIWPGNLKRYRLDGENILDQNSLVAVDGDTGFFKDTSHSYWSTLVDGSDVREGGTASKMTANRNLYVFDGAGNIIQSSNELHEDNSEITTALLGVDDELDADALREVLLKWARGIDVKDNDGDGDTTDYRLQMGDPIHSQPVVVNYGSTDSAILVATNQGMLHSFDAETGEENFGIMPKALLPNLHHFYEDISTFNHVYGLDGEMVLRTVGTSTYLYLGMRRGGRNYYVFDVTQKTSPTVKFVIEGGSTGLEKLGQTWSRPTITKVRYGTEEKNVMIIGGGYDDSQDDKLVRSADNIGNAVYMFDADTGSLLWHASNADADLNLADMNYSIPGRISVIDRDNDGFADHMYVGDMGGQLFRMDIYNGESGSNFIKGARLANFAGDTAETHRRFYYGPDVSEVALGDELYYAVAMGSGWRASPLDVTVEDNFYMLKDEGVFSRDASGQFTFMSTVSESDLYNATEHLLTSSDETEQGVAASSFANKAGWYIELTTDGEKVLASPLIVDYKIFFTTYVPAVSSTSLCAPPSGNSRAYLVNLFNANAVSDLNNNGELDSSDRSVELQQTGIAPETKILIEDITSPVVCLGTECASTVISVDDDGNEEPCDSAFECLAQNIYGKFERIQRGSWHSETEREDTSQ
ncbi:pilus assembly protein PilY [Alteromonas sp. KS69]|jgi:type IV pilus assembly protein PilY1|uniref:PilC/PilY family type IV pilus protein n=1 Tax=Alteromonas sp. KS69 TaxID=2109917 RepID=UPI000C120C0A|nr:PilC/PilY family type IV pilus protein [Alteromonas sp. KS69]PHS55106.1 MAG: pilus assembly protein PilY [Alteromonas sp.]RUP76720.1 pilus assembly protein PilY [Alteromonas sp. KS69]